MKLSSLLNDVGTVQASVDGKTYFPSRPRTAENTFLRFRIRAAWRVLIGRSDAIEWDQEEEALARKFNRL